MLDRIFQQVSDKKSMWREDMVMKQIHIVFSPSAVSTPITTITTLTSGVNSRKLSAFEITKLDSIITNKSKDSGKYGREK